MRHQISTHQISISILNNFSVRNISHTVTRTIVEMAIKKELKSWSIDFVVTLNSFLLNTLFLPTCCTYIYACLQWSFAFFLCYSSSTQFCLFFSPFIHIILCFALLNLCSYHVSTKNITESIRKRRRRRGKREKEIQNNDVQLMPFLLADIIDVWQYRIYTYVYTYIGKSIENVAPKRWKMTICMPSNWFACHFKHIRETCIIPILMLATSWLDIIGNIVDFQVSLHSFDILEWCQHIENIFMSSTWAEKIS